MTYGTDLLSNINKYIDQSALKPNLTYQDIINQCEEALKYNFASLCVNPYHVKICSDILKGSQVKVCSVISFPFGLSTLDIKIKECIKAIEDGAYELDEEEKIKALELVADSKADFIKTSTGFAPSGADLKDIKLWKSLAKDRIKIKASGGIRDLETAIKFIQAGADRIGTSSGAKITLEALKNVY